MIDLCTLGTGGTMPLPDRALASLYVRVGGRAVLVDCGEGTQIGIQRLSWGIQCIDAILLTHYHADHCSGLPGMLLAITKAGRTAPLHIYGPIGLERIVSGLRVIAPSLSYPIVLHEIIDDYSPFAAIGLMITPFPLRHEMPCIGYQFHLPRPALFDPIRARAQEIPVKLWSILQRGETVSMDGQTYYPHQVLGAAAAGDYVRLRDGHAPCAGHCAHGAGQRPDDIRGDVWCGGKAAFGAQKLPHALSGSGAVSAGRRHEAAAADAFLDVD